jgi:hypothetical protein
LGVVAHHAAVSLRSPAAGVTAVVAAVVAAPTTGRSGPFSIAKPKVSTCLSAAPYIACATYTSRATYATYTALTGIGNSGVNIGIRKNAS